MDKTLITIRRAELDGEAERLRARLEAITAERQELDIAERVIDRLSGAQRDSAGEANQPQPPQVASSRTKRPVTVRQMIMAALMDARQRGLPGRTPQEIREYIEATYGQKIGQQINTTASRMWHDIKEIDKDTEAGLFRLPLKEKPADLLSGGEQSAGYSQPARDGEPVQEVGHDNMS